jgi:hypothetical protein
LSDKNKDVVVKDVCGSAFELFEGTFPPFAWRTRGI